MLLVDLDPKAQATFWLGCYGEKRAQTVYDLLVDPDVEIEPLICETALTHLDLLPCNSKLAMVPEALNGVLGREMILAERLRTLQRNYDLCIIDTPPGYGMLSTCALVCASDIIVPVQPHFFAYKGLLHTLDRANAIKERFYPCDINVLGLAMTLVDNRSHMTRLIRAALHESFGDLVFNTEVHCNVAVSRAPKNRCPVLAFDVQSRGAREYQTLASEVGARLAETAE